MLKGKTNFKWLPGILVAGLFIWAAFATISDYGLTWDTPNHLPRGEAYLHFFFTGERSYPQPPGDRPCIFQDRDMNRILKSNQDGNHPPMPGILSAIGCDIFFKKLGLLKEIDAHHAMNIILAGITILAVYFFAAQVYNNWRIAFFAAVFMALFPRFLGHAHNNIKDIPQTAFFVLSLWTFWLGVSRKNWTFRVLSAIFGGLALVSKLTAIFLLPVMGMWLVSLKWEDIRWGSLKPSFKTVASVFLYLTLACAVFFAFWPYLWHDTINHLDHAFNFSHKLGTSLAFHKRTTETVTRPYYPYALGYLLITTPIVIIAMGMIGLKTSWRRIKNEGDPASLLILIWMLLSLLLVNMPGLHIYGGIRQFIFLVPAFCMIAAVGCEQSYQWLQKWGCKHMPLPRARQAAGGIIGGMVLYLLVMVLWTHPNQTSFFNLGIGGLWGAQKIGVPEATDYWANTYREGVHWLNKHAEDNALLNVAFGEHLVAAAKELRPGIELTSFENIQANHPRQAGYIMFVTKRSWYNYRTEYCHQNLKPVYVVEVQGASILEIYKYQ